MKEKKQALKKHLSRLEKLKKSAEKSKILFKKRADKKLYIQECELRIKFYTKKLTEL